MCLRESLCQFWILQCTLTDTDTETRKNNMQPISQFNGLHLFVFSRVRGLVSWGCMCGCIYMQV